MKRVIAESSNNICSKYFLDLKLDEIWKDNRPRREYKRRMRGTDMNFEDLDHIKMQVLSTN